MTRLSIQGYHQCVWLDGFTHYDSWLYRSYFIIISVIKITYAVFTLTHHSTGCQ